MFVRVCVLFVCVFVCVGVHVCVRSCVCVYAGDAHREKPHQSQISEVILCYMIQRMSVGPLPQS